MKFGLIAMLICCVGCVSSNYSTIKTGPDRYLLTGPDPNKLQGMAYDACKSDNFPDYQVLSSNKNSLTVQCEPATKPWKETLEEAWQSVKQKVQELSKEQDK